jgi:hypothetical protein
MSIIARVERIRLASRAELDRSRRMFETAGLTWSEPELVVEKENDSEYTAELKIEFYEDEDLVDLFEFFVCRDGVLITSEDEIRQWIRDNVLDVVQRRSQS